MNAPTTDRLNIVIFKISSTTISKIATTVFCSIIGALIGLLAWNLTTTHQLTNTVVQIQSDQKNFMETALSSLEKLTKHITLTSSEIQEMRIQNKTDYNNLSQKVDNITTQLSQLEQSNNDQERELSNIKVKQAERGGPADPLSADLKDLNKRLSTVEQTLIKLETSRQ